MFDNKKRLAWFSLALAAMLASAYCLFGWMSAVGRISGWKGLPKYEAEVPRLEIDAKIWLALTIALPFVAALLLDYGMRARNDREKPFASRYVENFGISLMGTVGFILVLFLFGLLLHRLRIGAG